MAKVQPIKKSLAQILKKKNITKSKQNVVPAKSLEVKTESIVVKAPTYKDEVLDAFCRQTAKDMLKGFRKVELHVNNSESSKNLSSMISDNSIWAPWSKLFKSDK